MNSLEMWKPILEKVLPSLFLLILMAFIVYCTIEFIKAILKSVKKEDISIPAELQRWLNFSLGYIFSWLFDFRFIEMVFKAVNPLANDINPFVCYFVNAIMMYKFAYLFYKYIKQKEIGFEKRYD